MVLLSGAAAGLCAQGLNRFPVKVGEVWGYIDNSGKTVIEPKFLNAGRFTEGLAPVRLNGTYGYIDSTGKFSIAPMFDLALPFEEGIAKVFLDGKPFFIGKNGNILFDHRFKGISSFGKSNYAVVSTETKKCGLINRNGSLILDTIYYSIDPVDDGMAVVVKEKNSSGKKEDKEDKVSYEAGLINMTGKWIVEPGRYYSIGTFLNGFAIVQLYDDKDKNQKSAETAVIDRSGKECFVIPSKKYQLDWYNEGFYDDVSVVSIYTKNPDKIKVWGGDHKYEYMGVINSGGTILFSNKHWRKLTPFANNRAFVQDDNEKWKLINKSGMQVGDSVFEEINLEDVYSGVPSPPFRDGIAFVKSSSGWCAIDTNGNAISKPVNLKGSLAHDTYRRGNVIVFMKDISVENPDYSFSYGFYNLHNNIVVEPEFHDLDMDHFDDALIYAMKDGKMLYIDYSGKVIWREPEVSADAKTPPPVLNIDYMNRGYFYASSMSDEENTGHGGSRNYSKMIPAGFPYEAGKLDVRIYPREKKQWWNYEAMKLVVANASSDTVYFDAQDCRLYLNMQAKDRTGAWKDIEYLPNSWCGNSYHKLFLEPRHCWEFATPVYAGEFQTKLRAKLVCRKSMKSGDDGIFYSNEVDGSVNPAQFWNRRGYQPSGLMDPYNE